jgi:hypothetical protein
MDSSKIASPTEKAPEPDTAEEICELLEQAMLKYFPQGAGNSGGPRSSVPLVPQNGTGQRLAKTPLVLE